MEHLNDGGILYIVPVYKVNGLDSSDQQWFGDSANRRIWGAFEA